MFKLYQRIQAHYYLFVKQYQKHAGLWVVPPLLKPRLEKEMSSQIGRKVTIEGNEKDHILNFKYLVSDIINSTL